MSAAPKRAPKLHDFAPDQATFFADVVEGLSAPRKRLPCKYLYDERGSRLFEKICALPEYYPTRTELAILEEHVGEMARAIGPRALVIEYGSGASVKTRLLLDALEDPVGYVPIDISREHLRETAEALHRDYPDLEILPVCADYTDEVAKPAPTRAPDRRVVFFPGSTLGNFDEGESFAFLSGVARVAGERGALLIGLDLRKDPRVLERAYDDEQGVTAEFNLNLLERINRELHSDFNPERFRHVAVWNDEESRMEMHLESLEDQAVDVDGVEFAFRAGETIWTESSHKYTREGFAELAGRTGFDVERVWTDAADYFSVQLLRVRS